MTFWAFCHIEKTAGTTINKILRNSMPLSHVDIIVKDKSKLVADEGDLSTSFRVYPNAKSLSGHSVRAYSDFGTFSKDCLLYTVVRNPIARFISDYKNDVRSRGFAGSLADFARFECTNDIQTKSLSISGHLQSAKNALTSRLSAFGIAEDLEGFLVRLNASMAGSPLRITNRRFNDSKRVDTNAAGGTGDRFSKEDIAAAVRANALDIDLYEYAVSRLPPPPINRVAIARDWTWADSARVELARGYRNLVYKPSVRRWPGAIDKLEIYRTNAAHRRDGRVFENGPGTVTAGAIDPELCASA